MKSQISSYIVKVLAIKQLTCFYCHIFSLLSFKLRSFSLKLCSYSLYSLTKRNAHLQSSYSFTCINKRPSISQCLSFFREERVLLGNAWNVRCKATEDVMCAPAPRIGYLIASKQTHQNNLFRLLSQYALVVLDSDTQVSSICAFHSHNPCSHCRLRVKCWDERSPSYNTVFLGFFWQEVSMVRWEEIAGCVCVCAKKRGKLFFVWAACLWDIFINYGHFWSCFAWKWDEGTL